MMRKCDVCSRVVVAAVEVEDGGLPGESWLMEKDVRDL